LKWVWSKTKKEMKNNDNNNDIKTTLLRFALGFVQRAGQKSAPI